MLAFGEIPEDQKSQVTLNEEKGHFVLFFLELFKKNGFYIFVITCWPLNLMTRIRKHGRIQSSTGEAWHWIFHVKINSRQLLRKTDPTICGAVCFGAHTFRPRINLLLFSLFFLNYLSILWYNNRVCHVFCCLFFFLFSHFLKILFYFIWQVCVAFFCHFSTFLRKKVILFMCNSRCSGGGHLTKP